MNFPFVDIHTHRQELCPANVLSIRSLRPREENDASLYSLSLHPWYIADLSAEYLQWLKDSLEKNDPRLCALGEVGLDRLSPVSVEIQREYFSEIISLSEQYQKPLILHIVKAWDDLIRLKRELKPKMPWIIHGFRGNPMLARQLINDNFLLSFGQRFNADSMRLANESEALLLETDESSLLISDIYAQSSEVLNCTLAELKEELWRRILQIFPNLDLVSRNSCSIFVTNLEIF